MLSHRYGGAKSYWGQTKKIHSFLHPTRTNVALSVTMTGHVSADMLPQTFFYLRRIKDNYSRKVLAMPTRHTNVWTSRMASMETDTKQNKHQLHKHSEVNCSVGIAEDGTKATRTRILNNLEEMFEYYYVLDIKVCCELLYCDPALPITNEFAQVFLISII